MYRNFSLTQNPRWRTMLVHCVREDNGKVIKIFSGIKYELKNLKVRISFNLFVGISIIKSENDFTQEEFSYIWKTSDSLSGLAPPPCGRVWIMEIIYQLSAGVYCNVQPAQTSTQQTNAALQICSRWKKNTNPCAFITWVFRSALRAKIDKLFVLPFCADDNICGKLILSSASKMMGKRERER